MVAENSNNTRHESYLRNDFIEMWIEDGILFAVYLPDTVLTLEIAKKCVEDRHKITKGLEYPLLADVREIAGETREALKYFGGAEGTKNLTAGAFIVKRYVPEILANIYLNLTKPKVPSRIFKRKENALKWLESYKNSNS